MNYMKPDVVQKVLNDIGGRFFTIEFVANDGEPRRYNGRINVKKGLKDNERSEMVRKAFRENGVVPMKIDGERYKAFKLDKVLKIVSMGEEYTV